MIYQVFKKTSTIEEIIKAYRKLSLKFHPNKNPGKEKEYGEIFKKIGRAYQILKNEEYRKIYDEKGEKGVSEI